MEEEEACSMTGAVASVLREAVSKTKDALMSTAWGLVKLSNAWLGLCCQIVLEQTRSLALAPYAPPHHR